MPVFGSPSAVYAYACSESLSKLTFFSARSAWDANVLSDIGRERWMRQELVAMLAQLGPPLRRCNKLRRPRPPLSRGQGRGDPVAFGPKTLDSRLRGNDDILAPVLLDQRPRLVI